MNVNRLTSSRAIVKGALILTACMLGFWVLYGFFGHRVIESLYQSDSIKFVMGERRLIPLADYLVRADRKVLVITFSLITLLLSLLLLVAFIKKPGELTLSCFVFFLCSFLLFCFLEVFPSLARPLRLHIFDYYRDRDFRIADETLGYRNKPLLHLKIHNVKTQLHSSLYDVEEEPRTLEWVINRNGFRDRSDGQFSDVVLIGDSFIESGWNEADTFGKRLEKHLPGWTVANLGISGYGPYQYLEVLKRYAIQQNPRIVFFCFYEGNDPWNIGEYQRWKESGSSLAAYAPGSKGFWGRYLIVLSEAWRSLETRAWTTAELVLKKITQSQYLYPDVAVVKLPNGNIHKMVFADLHDAISTEKLLRTGEWQELRKILSQFKNISVKHRITPVILYIPMTSSVYAEYSTEESGMNWRLIRENQILWSKNIENALLSLSRDVGLESVNLTDAFRPAASAAAFVAEILTERFGTVSKFSP